MRSGSGPSDLAADLHEDVSRMAGVLRDKREEVEGVNIGIRSLLPEADATTEWLERVTSLVNEGLFTYPTTLSVRPTQARNSGRAKHCWIAGRGWVPRRARG